MKIPPHATYSPTACDDSPGDYFVSAIDAGHYHLMAGPYTSHAAALAAVDAAREATCSRDGRGHFMAWGTCRLDCGSGRIGNLNRAGIL